MIRNFLEYQQTLCDAINADAVLVQADCKAFAEDALDVDADVARHLQEAGGVAIMVATPEAEFAGAAADGGLLFDLQRVEVVCTEYPSLNRQREGAVTALCAALRIAFLLRSRMLPVLRISQGADADAGLLTATVTFSDCVRFDPVATDSQQQGVTNEPSFDD